MLLEWIRVTEEHLRRFVRQHHLIELDQLVVESPPHVKMGDLAFPFPFELARTLRRAPRQIAQETVESIDTPAPVDRFEAAGAGYVNVFFKRTGFFAELRRWLQEPPSAPAGEKIIVEHTNINPNKAAHIGHLRNAALGDTFVRLLKSQGRVVEIQNYIDNTGVQVADVVVGFRHLRDLSLDQVRKIEDPFDYYCWDLYAEVSSWFKEDPARTEIRHRTLHEIEEGSSETAQLAEYIAMRIVRAHLLTMDRLGVRYDLLPRESDILHLKFWDQAFEQLKQQGAVSFSTEGAHKGCWVMQLPAENGQPEDEKIIVRSNGTVTYVGKDIAYQLWKFGLLGRTFYYRPFFQYSDSGQVYATTSEETENGTLSFGDAARVYNVIDVRQSYLQRVVVQGLRSLGFVEESNRSIHFSYEMVALSPACCAEMGIELSPEDQAKPYVEVSGRKGLGVKADDLIDKLIEKSLQEVRSRHPDLPTEEQDSTATQIAIGALRYFLLKYSRNSVIAFDFNEALSFEGETGPYLQYSVVRANNIFRKMEEQTPGWKYEDWIAGTSGEELPGDLLADEEIWALVLLIARTAESVEQSAKTLEVSYLAKHAFTLAQQFNLFYHKYHILSEENATTRDFYLMVTDASRRILLRILDTLGIEVPKRM